jgi:integrase
MPKKVLPKKEKAESLSWPFVTWQESRKRWMCDARTGNGGKRTFHTTKDDADAEATKARILRSNEGLSAFESTELSSFGWTVQQAIRFAIEHLKSQSKSMEIGKAITHLLESKKTAGRSDAYCRTLKINTTKIGNYFRDRKISTITAAEIQAFIASFTLAPATKNTIRRDCVTLWTHALKAGWVTTNVAELTDQISDVEKAPEIFTPSQVADLMNHSTGDIAAFHAIGFFAGLRVSEIHRLDWREIDLEGGFIHIKATKSKTRSRRLVPILPNLALWLKDLKKDHGPVVEPNFWSASCSWLL